MAEKTFHSLTLPGQDTARVPLTAAEFSTQVAYKVKDYCTYQGKLYRCITAHAAGTWNAAHFIVTDIDTEFDRKLDIPVSQASAPTNPRVGDLWIDNDENSPVYNTDIAPILGSSNAVQSGGVKIALNSLDSRKMEHGVITGDFSESVDYRIGDLVFYATTANGITTRTLYRCITDHNASTWNADDFTATTIEVELQKIRDSEADTDMIGDLFGAKYIYSIGDYCIYNDNLYKCIRAIDNTGNNAPAFNPSDWEQVNLANEVGEVQNKINNFLGDILNVKDFGAVGDGVTNDTNAFKEMFLTDAAEYYIPAGKYIVGPFICGTNKDNGKLVTHNIKIFGDGPGLTQLILKNESIPSQGPLSENGCMMFLFEGPTDQKVSIEISNLFIDMNRRRNNYDSTFTPEQFDPWYLQHCHAICIRSHNFASINAIINNVEFYDLIADGILFNSNNSEMSFDDIIVDKVVSKGRNAKRSDVCITGDFNSAIISNCSLDDFEIEVNYFGTNNLHYFTMDNCNIRNKIDLTSKWNPSLSNATLKNSSKYIINNCNIFGKINFSSLHAVFSACHLSASESIYTQNSDVQFINCEIEDNSTLNDDWKSPGMIYNIETGKGVKLKFFGCDISCNHYRNFVCLRNEINDNNININDLIIENNNFKVNLISDSSYGGNCFRIGNMNVYAVGNRINLVGQSNASFILVGYPYVSSKTIVIKNNILLIDCTLLKIMRNMVSSNKVVTIKAKGNVLYNSSYINTYRWLFDEITPFRGGSGTAYKIQEIDDYELDNIPITGMWVLGQKIYNTNPNNNIIGWVCTKSGYAAPGVSPAAEFSPISFNT